MDCRQFRECYSDYCDGLLHEAEEVACALHLAECGACRKFDAAWRRGVGALRNSPPLECSRRFAEQLQERLRREVARSRPTPALGSFAVLAGVMLVVVVAAAFVGIESAGWSDEQADHRPIPPIRRYSPASPIPIAQPLHASDTLAETDPFRVMPAHATTAAFQLAAGR